MSWHSDLSATQKAQFIFLKMVFEELDKSFKFPLPRGAYSYGGKPSWYDGVPLHMLVKEPVASPRP